MFTIVNQIWNAFLDTLITMCKQLKISVSVNTAAPSIFLNESAKDLRKTLQYGKIPFFDSETLQINDLCPNHTEPLLRAVSKLSNTYPTDVVDATLVDDWVSTHRDFMIPLEIHDHPEKFGIMTKDGWHKERIWLETHISNHLHLLEVEVQKHNWIGGMSSLSMADVVWFETLCWIKCGACKYISPQNLSKYPGLEDYFSNVTESLYGGTFKCKEF